MDNMIQLLNDVKAIKERYEEISKRTGKNFNILKILKLQSNEMRSDYIHPFWQSF